MKNILLMIAMLGALSCSPNKTARWDAGAGEDDYWSTVLVFEVLLLEEVNGAVEVRVGDAPVISVPVYSDDTKFELHRRIARCSVEAEDTLVGWAAASKDWVELRFGGTYWSLKTTNPKIDLNLISY